MNHFWRQIGTAVFFTIMFVAKPHCVDGATPGSGDSAAGEAADAAEDDVQALQGTWTSEYRNGFGATIRKELFIQGDIFTVTDRDPKGNIFVSVQSTFKLSHEGSVCIATHNNVLTTAGADYGQRPAGPQVYLYRLEGDQFYNVYGMLDNDPASFSTIVWDRAK